MELYDIHVCAREKEIAVRRMAITTNRNEKKCKKKDRIVKTKIFLLHAYGTRGCHECKAKPLKQSNIDTQHKV